MTKRNRLAIIFALFAFSILLTGCYRVEDTESKEPEKDHTIEQLKEQVSEGKRSSSIYSDDYQHYYSDYTVSEDGKYFMFTTESKQVYLNFIEDFDTETYEIVDTTILHAIEYNYGLYFVVTYRAIQ